MNYLDKLIPLFEDQRNEEQAAPMKKYMKNHFSFLGIKTPARVQLMKEFYIDTAILKRPFQRDLVLTLWGKQEREYQYAALDYIGRSLKKLEKDDLFLLEKLITAKSWWDTVDALAQNPVAKLAASYPEVIPETIDSFVIDENIWLQRTAILFQLKYKQDTDEALLYHYIKHNAASTEFFIQKAIGWALREYSKTNPDSVRDFIKESDLAKLSIREGSKYLK
ncbi:DNA alkylation repair protein [Virgibacillus phasianinus]|uniref:DNA alkylation repair protein n=1 Tax=Virgibacillus phasianinus TaxID=2017483 RepID=A0A220U5N8_9BACI|nr:DNA alkylation repair protein [Virgibacillus phasianinus]ASK63410.1 DNA alkylation repair protein [Virgibacillus phasianinus]